MSGMAMRSVFTAPLPHITWHLLLEVEGFGFSGVGFACIGEDA